MPALFEVHHQRCATGLLHTIKRIYGGYRYLSPLLRFTSFEETLMEEFFYVVKSTDVLLLQIFQHYVDIAHLIVTFLAALEHR